MHRIGRYNVTGTLGEGGMGVVYRAQDSELMREVALKVIRWEKIGAEGRSDAEARSRFDREAKVAAQLKHPGIVTIYDRGEWEGSPFLVMELVEGRTLQALLRARVLEQPQLLSIFEQVAAALDYAASRGVIHRDLKPANIIVQNDGVAKIMDFGIAKMAASGDGETRAGFIMGTPSYMPPERLAEGLDAPANDVWALAVTAYESLAGQKPFQGPDWQTVTYKICNQPAPDPRVFNAALPAPAAETFARALSKKVEDRFPDAVSFAGALSASFQQAVPLEPPRPPDPPVEEAPPRRSPYRVAALAGVALGVVIAAIVWFLYPGGNGKPIEEPAIPRVPKAAAPAPRIETPTGVMMLAGSVYIDKTEVSNRTYRQFCEAAGRPLPEGLAAADPDLPAVNVSHGDAEAYAAWAGKRLPTAAEWEIGARGPDGWLLPWGNEWQADHANLGDAGGAPGSPAKVDSFPQGSSPYGLLHMAGNVWEWTGEAATAPPEGPFARYARLFRDLNPPLTREEPYFQVRGGSFRFTPRPEEATRLCSDFSPMPARARRADIGFRCVRAIPTDTETAPRAQ